MVDMSPEAVTARLIELSEASRALVGKPGPQAVSMSREAVTARLREWAELTRMCLLLEREVGATKRGVVLTETDVTAQPPGHETEPERTR